mmetsp:Transcript_49193/g.56661  ORF Transcript_49193/g.56661 Transcript_49193/m.56661 type:complete len:207 (-) Transcript_49193:510-1130(-)
MLRFPFHSIQFLTWAFSKVASRMGPASTCRPQASTLGRLWCTCRFPHVTTVDRVGSAISPPWSASATLDTMERRAQSAPLGTTESSVRSAQIVVRTVRASMVGRGRAPVNALLRTAVNIAPSVALRPHIHAAVVILQAVIVSVALATATAGTDGAAMGAGTGRILALPLPWMGAPCAPRIPRSRVDTVTLGFVQRTLRRTALVRRL